MANLDMSAWVQDYKTEARHSSPVEASNGETALTTLPWPQW